MMRAGLPSASGLQITHAHLSVTVIKSSCYSQSLSYLTLTVFNIDKSSPLPESGDFLGFHDFISPGFPLSSLVTHSFAPPCSSIFTKSLSATVP